MSSVSVSAQDSGATPAAPEAIPFAEMASACPSTSVDAAHRLDPYWFGLWAGGSQVSWTSRALVQRLADAGVGRLRRADARVSPEQAMEAMCVPKLRARRCAVMAAIGLWRTLTAEQIAAITGAPSLAKSPGDLRTAWSAGLVEEGRFVASTIGTQHNRASRSTVYRPVNSPAFTRFANALPYNEWLSVTAGRPWKSESDHDRHNLLAAELGLRVAEFAEVGTVFGETLSGFDLLSAHPGAPGGVVGTGQHSTADVTCVRTDGMRIAVELTASTSPDFSRKVQRWAQLLMDTDPDDNGLTVVFVEASNPDRAPHSSVWNTLRTAVANAAYSIPGSMSRRVPERMAVARWRDWFPAPLAASRGFRVLAAEVPNGPHDARWNPVSLLDPIEHTFAPRDPEASTAVLRHTPNLLGVPHWLRTGPGVDVAAILREQAGFATAPSPARARGNSNLRRGFADPAARSRHRG